MNKICNKCINNLFCEKFNLFHFNFYNNTLQGREIKLKGKNEKQSSVDP